jgi:AraC-like DNA-binding protein
MHASAHGHDEAARQRRDVRDLLVRELRAEDPKKWTMSALAAEVGCSKELIAYILKTEDRDAGPGDDLPVQEPGT